jgi:hypothetical protein
MRESGAREKGKSEGRVRYNARQKIAHQGLEAFSFRHMPFNKFWKEYEPLVRMKCGDKGLRAQESKTWLRM